MLTLGEQKKKSNLFLQENGNTNTVIPGYRGVKLDSFTENMEDIYPVCVT